MPDLKPWIECHRPNPNGRLRLFCFPYAGGPAQSFRKWQDQLPGSVEVCPIQLPGRWSRLREAPFRRIDRLVQAAAEALRPHMSMPFALFGHSLGALIAFEMARHLRRAGASEPLQLFVSARRAPQLPRASSPIFALPDHEFIEQMRLRYSGIPQEVLDAPDLLELLLPAMRADMEVFDTYQYVPGAPLGCPISVFGGATDPTVGREQLEAWRDQTTAAFSLRILPGGHFFLHSAADLLLVELSGALERLDPTRSSG